MSYTLPTSFSAKGTPGQGSWGGTTLNYNPNHANAAANPNRLYYEFWNNSLNSIYFDKGNNSWHDGSTGTGGGDPKYLTKNLNIQPPATYTGTSTSVSAVQNTDDIELWDNASKALVFRFVMSGIPSSGGGGSGSSPTISYLDATLFNEISNGVAQTWNGIIHTDDVITHADFTLTKNSNPYPNSRLQFAATSFTNPTGGPDINGYKYRILHWNTGTYGVTIGGSTVSASLTGSTPTLDPPSSSPNRFVRFLDGLTVPATYFQNALATEILNSFGWGQTTSPTTIIKQFTVVIAQLPLALTDTTKDYTLRIPGLSNGVYSEPESPDGIVDTTVEIEIDFELDQNIPDIDIDLVENIDKPDETVVDTIVFSTKRSRQRNFW